MTNGQFVSRIVNGYKALTKDDHISKRYILRIGQDKSKFYISQKLLDKSLLREDNLFKKLTCFEMVSDDRISCGNNEFIRCKSLMKSKVKIPGLVYSRYGASIISITNIDGSVIYTPTSEKVLKNMSSRVGASKFLKNNYYISDNFLYLPNSEVEYVNVTYIPFDEFELNETKDKDCKECNESTHTEDKVEGCKSIWDSQFMVPDKLIEQVVKETIQEVLASRGIPKDENPNLDSNLKSQTEK